jgi:hypothetical protein
LDVGAVFTTQDAEDAASAGGVEAVLNPDSEAE